MRVKLDDKSWEIFYKNFIAGTGWVFGMTVGFTLLFSLLSFILGKLGGLPLVGEFVASLIEVTKNALTYRSY